MFKIYHFSHYKLLTSLHQNYLVKAYQTRDEKAIHLFTLEDLYGLTVSEANGEVCLKVYKEKGKDAHELLKMLYAWKELALPLSKV